MNVLPNPLHPLLKKWWTDNPNDPDRPGIDHPDVRALAHSISPCDRPIDLAGTMSLNALLPTAALVLRVHQPFVSRHRLRFEQAVRTRLREYGLLTPVPVSFHGTTILGCGSRLAEIEPFIRHSKPPHNEASYLWLLGEMGRAHRHLSRIEFQPVGSPAATYAPPGSLARWLSATIPALSISERGTEHGERLRKLANAVRGHWVPARNLPEQIVHGDFRLGNIVRDDSNRTVFLDFGFMNRRPRVHDIGYALAFMILALGRQNVGIELIERLIDAYGASSEISLSPLEIEALPASAASVMLHAAAHDGYTADPLANIGRRQRFLDVAEWIFKIMGGLP